MRARLLSCEVALEDMLALTYSPQVIACFIEQRQSSIALTSSR